MLGKDGNPPSRDYIDAMPYTQSLLESGKAIGYHAKAAPPTVTMPRLKVTGIVYIVLFLTHKSLSDLSLLILSLGKLAGYGFWCCWGILGCCIQL